MSGETISANGVRFSLSDSGRAVPCRITCEALEDMAGDHDADLDYLAAFEANKDELEIAARRILNSKRVDLSDAVLIQSSDVNKNWSSPIRGFSEAGI
jgi:hypothetical protein